MRTEYPYMVISNRNGEIGWSSGKDLVEIFKIYKEAKEYYDKIEVSEHRHDWSVNYKTLFRVRVMREK